jgi:hypothetical protein
MAAEGKWLLVNRAPVNHDDPPTRMLIRIDAIAFMMERHADPGTTFVQFSGHPENFAVVLGSLSEMDASMIVGHADE